MSLNIPQNHDRIIKPIILFLLNQDNHHWNRYLTYITNVTSKTTTTLTTLTLQQQQQQEIRQCCARHKHKSFTSELFDFKFKKNLTRVQPCNYICRGVYRAILVLPLYFETFVQTCA